MGWFDNALAQADKDVQGFSTPYSSAPPDLIGDTVDRKVALINQGIDPDRPALYVSPERQGQLLHNTLLGAEAVHQSVLNDSHISAGRSFAHYANDLATWRDTYKNTPGSPEAEVALLKIHADPANAEGARSEAGVALGRPFISFHDKSVDMAQRLKDRLTAMGQAHDYKMEEKNTNVPSNVITRVAKLQGDMVQHLEASAVEEGKNSKLNLANVPYSKAAQLHATQAELNGLVKRYPSLTDALNITVPALGGAVPQAQPQVTTAPSMALPKSGDVVKGYKFRGGDPADQKNWEKQ